VKISKKKSPLVETCFEKIIQKNRSQKYFLEKSFGKSFLTSNFATQIAKYQPLKCAFS